MSDRAARPSDHAVRPSHRLVARARIISLAASVLVMLIGGLSLAGWIFDVDTLKGIAAGIHMKANTAVSLVLAGASLFLLNHGELRGWPRLAGRTAAMVVGLVGAATLSQHLFGWDLGIDQLLFREAPGAVATASPGRMGPPASTSFTLAGIALLLLYARRFPSLAQLLSAIIGAIALLSTIGFAYGVEMLYVVAAFTGIALHTAVALLALSAGLIAASVDRGFAALLAGEGAGSLMARRLLAMVLPLLLLLGWLRLALEARGYYETEFGTAALTLVTMVILAVLILVVAAQLNRIEQGRLAAEANLRDRVHEIETMMEVLPVGLFIATDRTAATIIGNRAAREFLRMPRPEDNLSLTAAPAEAPNHFRVFHDGVEVPPEDLPVQRAAREGIGVHMEVDVVFTDGEVRHALIGALPLLDRHGRPRGAVASVMDITARRAAEREREELLARESDARAEAEAANRAKDEFLATVSHELRTPLNAILGWASLLRDGEILDEPTTEQALAAIEHNSKTQAQLIEDLLDISRITAGRLRLEIEPVDLIHVIRAAVDTVRPAADARKVEFRLSLDPSAALVRGDASRLQQVVWNLLTNAVKFNAPGGAVDVQLAAAGSDAVITVTDRGVGIDPAFLPYVFERFQQADAGRTRSRGGLGLGLAIARNLVEMHGGTIEATSDGIGRGARFTVRLPLLRSEAPTSRAEIPRPAEVVGRTDGDKDRGAEEVVHSDGNRDRGAEDAHRSDGDSNRPANSPRPLKG